MAIFEIAYEKTLKLEGGYSLTNHKNDLGKLTYSGISRKYHPDWIGWLLIDKKQFTPELTQLVRLFYKENFWNKIKGDDIINQNVANNIYDFSVNAGIRTAVKLAQIIINCTADGIIGNITLEYLNKINENDFIQKYFMAKIARYSEICNKNSSQKVFLLGWINRSLKVLS